MFHLVQRLGGQKPVLSAKGIQAMQRARGILECHAVRMVSAGHHIRFWDGVLLAQFMTGLKTADTARAPHILLLGVKLRGDKLDGSLAAVAMNQRFCYPHWIELRRGK